MALSGETLVAGRYRLLDKLGAGGVATVFLAEDERLGRRVAVKRLHAHGAEDMARRFEREARLGAALNHPSLVAIYDITAGAEEVVIVMEYVAGRTLADAVRDGPLDSDRALEVLREVAAGLDHAHAQGVVHRDVKPANVLLGDDGRVKLADLGIAVAADATSITGTGTVLGTPAYMAPEQLEGREPGPAVDVYALATVGFEALTGQKARQGRTPLEVAHRIATEPAPDVREAWPDAPSALSEALCAGMAYEPDARPPSAGALVERVEAAVAEAEAAPTGGLAAGPATQPVGPAAEPAAPPPGAPRTGFTDGGPAEGRSSGFGRWAALAAVVLLVGAVLFAVLASGGGEEAAQEPSDDPAVAEEEPQGATPTRAERAPAAAPAPEQAVTSFYESSAASDYDAAWALATPAFRQQLGGRAAFEQGQSTLESIEFEETEVVEEGDGSAEVAISTVATHSDGVDECEGTLQLVSGSAGGWLIDGASIACPETTRP